jgi:hypothetical protein
VAWFLHPSIDNIIAEFALILFAQIVQNQRLIHKKHAIYALPNYPILMTKKIKAKQFNYIKLYVLCFSIPKRKNNPKSNN